MKTIARGIAIYTVALYLLPFIVPGVKIEGGFLTFLIGGAVLALMFFVLKPILTIISLPVNLLTLGLFSTFINSFLLFALTILVSGISIEAFAYPAVNIFGFAIPRLYFTTVFAYIYTAFVLSFIDSFLTWLMT